jgi:hypothetical protein
MSISTAAVLETSARRLFPDKTVEQVLAQLLLERAQKNLIKYQTVARQFEVKYNQGFDAFRQKMLSSQPAFEVEQDYFDWELAITGIADMEKEIEQLRNLDEVEMLLAAKGLP